MSARVFRLNSTYEQTITINKSIFRLIRQNGEHELSTSTGSSFFLRKNGMFRLYTAKHVIDQDFPISLKLVIEEGNEVDIPLRTNNWILDPALDIAYLPTDGINFFGIDIPNTCFDYLNIGTDIEIIPPQVHQRSMEMYGFPVPNMKGFRRITFLATNEVNMGNIYTSDPSIQGFSGGPLMLPTTESHGNMVSNHEFSGVIGVISGTHSDNTGGKLGVVCLIVW